MSYRIAESTVAGWFDHIFASCEEFEAWAREHPEHGEIKSRSFITLANLPVAGTVDHRLDAPQQAEAQPVENMRLF